jgi:hypothetical protein
MAEHVLLTCATRRPYQTAPAVPNGGRYDPVRGYWLKDNGALVAADEFGERVTKKCDQETGEDQKGE